MTILLDPDGAASTTEPGPTDDESGGEAVLAGKQVAEASASVAEDVLVDVADDSTSSATPGQAHDEAPVDPEVGLDDARVDDDTRPPGKIVTVFAPKGGAGKTTVSTNLAVVLNASGANRVCLVDIDLEFGDIAIALRLAPTNTLLDYVQAADGTADDRRVAATTSFQPGLDCVLAPVSPADSEYISASMSARYCANCAGTTTSSSLTLLRISPSTSLRRWIPRTCTSCCRHPRSPL